MDEARCWTLEADRDRDDLANHLNPSDKLICKSIMIWRANLVDVVSGNNCGEENALLVERADCSEGKK